MRATQKEKDMAHVKQYVTTAKSYHPGQQLERNCKM